MTKYNIVDNPPKNKLDIFSCFYFIILSTFDFKSESNPGENS